MKEWHRILNKVLTEGESRNDRTGVGTLALFGEALEFDNSITFPAITTKKLFWKPMAGELAGFLEGTQDNERFKELGCNIWDGNGNADYWIHKAKFKGDLGRIYGVQWKDWTTVNTSDGVIKHLDQIKTLVDGIKKEPHSRRHLVTALNPGEFDQMCLPPCHVFFQVYVRGTDIIDLVVYMRSVDLGVGLPFDVASFALLQRLIAQEVGMKSGKLKFFLGDAHIYKNHIDQVKEILARPIWEGTTLHLDEGVGVFNFNPEHSKLVNYQCCDTIKMAMNV